MNLTNFLNALENSGLSLVLRIEESEALKISIKNKKISIDIRDAKALGKITKELL